MELFNNTLSILMNQRLKWLNARGQVIVSNIANADNKAMTRKELKPFRQVLSNSPRKMAEAGKPLSEVRDMRITEDDIVTTKTEISREIEMLEMAHNAMEHDALISIVRNFHKIFRTIIGKK